MISIFTTFEFMHFPNPLQPAILVKRYKRFLADVITEDGEELTVHCPNSGSMKGCSTPGSRVMLSTSDNPKRKYLHTLEMVQEGETWVGVNTMLTNTLVAEAIMADRVKELDGIEKLTREIKISESSRLDLLLERGDEKIYVEIKNCSLAEDGWAMFPDAVTARGTKHLNELANLVANGNQGVLFFCIQRTDVERFRPAADIDPLYAETLVKVAEKGVQILAYQAEVTPECIEIKKFVPVSLGEDI